MKNLDLLKQELFDVSHEGILKYLIPVLEDFEKRIDDNWASQKYIMDTLKEMNKKVKKLEQAQTYFPPMEMEYHEVNDTGGVDNTKIGGQDDRGNIFNLYEKKGDD